MMINTTSKTKLFGIFGTPIGHTISPKMHSFLANKYGVDMAYLAFDVSPERLDEAVLGAKTMGAYGFNITAPHKIAIMKHMDVLCPDAVLMNAVNTIVNKNGVWHGYNTDGDGFCRSLALEGCEIENKDILMLGAGGSARALSYKLAKYGAKSISMESRTREKISIIGDMVEKHTDTLFFDCVDEKKAYDIIINTTPVGMHPNENENPCPYMKLVRDGVTCVDIIYNPPHTMFLKEAEEKGARIINGLGMLVCQGILAFEHFHGLTLNHKECYEELMELFKEHRL